MAESDPPPTVDDQPLTLWVAEDITPLHNGLMTYRISALVILLAALAAVALLQTQVIRRAFGTLTPQQQQLKELRLGQREQLETQEHPDEIAPLAEEIDRLLALMDERSCRTRNAIGNLAHEMKRPLQQLQLLSETALKDHPEHQDIAAATKQLQTLIQRELKRARIIGMATPGRHFRPKDDLPALVGVLAQIYPATRVITQYPKDALLPYDRDDVLEMIGNLLDNACKYGGNSASLTLRHSEHQWHIIVTDDGPGIADDQRESLLARGHRIDESGTEGSGLGLSIVKAIVDSYHGTLQLHSNAGGGLTVIVQLPCADGH